MKLTNIQVASAIFVIACSGVAMAGPKGSAQSNTAKVKNPEPAISDNVACRWHTITVPSNEGLLACNRLIQQGHGTSVVYSSIGNYWRVRGKLDDALDNYARAIALDPGNSIPVNGRGLVYSARGQSDQAIISYSDAMKLDPENLIFVVNRASEYLVQNNFDLAIKDCSFVLEIESKEGSDTATRAYNMRGNAFFRAEKYEEALADYNAAIRVGPGNENASQKSGDKMRPDQPPL